MRRAFQPVARNIKRHFGVTAKHVAVRSHRLWYWQVLSAVAYLLIGYLLAYWQLTGGDFGALTTSLHTITQQNAALESKYVQTERQLQVAQAAQKSLAKDFASIQDESIRLKEDVAFYKNILNENVGGDVLKLHSFKINPGVREGEWEYHVLLVQSGKHDKIVKGTLNLQLNGLQAAQPVKLALSDGIKTLPPVEINFKYYQRVDGSFVVPANTTATGLELSFNETGLAQARITGKITFPK